MKRISTIFFVILTAFSAYSQNYLQDGNRCFDKGDYACAISKYEVTFKSASGKDKQIAEIKLATARKCAECINTANQAFNSGDYRLAKDYYQKVLDSNPKDEYAKSQLEKCNTALNPPPKPTLRKATTAELADIWNNKYGVLPARRQNLINAGIDPIDAQTRINKGEGKPIVLSQQTITTLTVSSENITFNANGGSTKIDVKTNASDFEVALLPYWCKIGTKSSNWFSLVCDASNGMPRDSYFRVTAGGKEILIYINQSGIVSTQTNTNSNSSSNKTDKPTIKSNKCFNCPKAKYPWGFTLGHINKAVEFNQGDYYSGYNEIDGIQLGIRFEPLFKYGFGLNMGLNYEYYSTFNSYKYSDDEYNFQEHVLNIPFHLEYRFNFSKYFNIFAYGGVGLDIITDSSFSEFATKVAIEYGCGLRIDHVQFNIGQSVILKDFDFESISDINYSKYKNLVISMSYMF